MDIREYVIALSVVCRPAKTLETMKLAFKVCSLSSNQPCMSDFYLLCLPRISDICSVKMPHTVSRPCCGVIE